LKNEKCISRTTWPPKPSEEGKPPPVSTTMATTTTTTSDSDTNQNNNETTTTSTTTTAVVGVYGKGRGGWLQWAAQSILSSGEPSEWEGGSTIVPPVLLTEGKDFRRGNTKVFIKDPSAVQQLEEARAASLRPV
jgi:hypothetical protein